MKLSRNVIWNIAGIVLPLVVGVTVVPTIVRQLGVERFGFLSVIWMLIGYFSIFDLGLGRALTKLAADRLSSGREEEIPLLASTTLIVVAISGVVVGGMISLLSEWIATTVLSGSPALVSEGSAAVIWLAISLPFVLLTTVLIGMLEAYQKFALINAVRLPVGVLMYVVPVAVLPFSRDLDVITAALAVIRVINACVLVLLSFRIVPALRREIFVFRRSIARSLLTFGGWLTVSNIVGPVMVYFDRFLIGAVLGSAAITYYTVPYDVLTRLWAIPVAIQGVLFPAFAIMRGQASPRVVPVFARSSQITMLFFIAPLFATLLLAYEGLELWVGIQVAQNSTAVAKILAIGVLVNAMAQTPFSFVQSAGYARWTAMLHLIELPLYISLLWWLLNSNGIEGAAYAWCGRIILDAIVLYALVVRLDRRLAPTVSRTLLSIAAVCMAAACFSWIFTDLLVRILVVAFLATACGALLLRDLKGVLFSFPKSSPGNSA